MDSGRERRKIQPVRQSFKHQRSLLEMTRRKKNLMMSTHSTESTLRNSLETQPKCNIMGRILSKSKDQGLKFWQTKSVAIMTYASKPGDCIDRVISQDGDRVMFESLENPRPAPKETLKKNWPSQQQQHSSSNTDVLRLWKQETKKGRPGLSTKRHGPLHRSGSHPQETGGTPL